MKWPWQCKRGSRNPYAPNRWPKKVYFLDGPMAGKTGTSLGGFCVTVPYVKNPTPAPGIYHGYGVLPSAPDSRCDVWRYEWETVYTTGNVAFVRFAS